MTTIRYKTAAWRESMELRFDYANCMAERVPKAHGLTPRLLERCLERAGKVLPEIEKHSNPRRKDTWSHEHAYLGWWHLPEAADTLRRVTAYARKAHRGFDCDAVLVLGIGGSALGTIALRTALLAPFHNELPARKRQGPRLYVMDNVDPAQLAGALALLDRKRTLVCVVAKSGSTVETLSSYMVVREWLGETGKALSERLVFVTRAKGGALNELADAEREESGAEIDRFEVPYGVGGRFSVLSSVGLVPAALCGMDVAGLLAGAAAMKERCRSKRMDRNPAALFAAVHYLLDTQKGKSIQVMMPYAAALRDVADWFCQLWAESLGKRREHKGKTLHTGQTPVKALGATDQHSQVQLYVDGPFDKVVTFLSVGDIQPDLVVPDRYPAVAKAAYLRGKKLGDILRIEEAATRLALCDAGRPSCTIALPEVNAYTAGQLFFLLEAATAFAGGLYRINAFDQPGVEQGKHYAYGALGREDYEPFAEKLAAAQGRKSKHVV